MIGKWLRSLIFCVLVPLLAYVAVVVDRMGTAPAGVSNGTPVPGESAALTGAFKFTDPRAVSGAPAPLAALTPGGDRELALWDAVQASTDPADLRDYLTQFPNGTFSALAHRRLAALETSPTAPASSSAAEPNSRIVAIAPAAAAPSMSSAAAPRPIAFRFEIPAGPLAPRPLRFDAEAKGDALALAGNDGGRGAQRRECRGDAAIDATGVIAPFELVCRASGATRPTSRIELRGRLERRGDSATLRLVAVAPKSRLRELRVPDRVTAEKAAAQRAAAAKARGPAASPVPDAPVLAARPPADFSAEHALFQIDLPANAMETSAKRLGVEVADGLLMISGRPSGAQSIGSQDCFGQTAVATSGALTPFDVRCNFDSDRGMQYFTALRGRLVDEGDRLVLELKWRDSFGKSGEIRVPAL